MAVISGNSPNNFATPPAAPAPAASNVPTDKASLDQTYSQFLSLLTTQLKNQDPLSPMDSTQFTSQLVSFSQVEQQLKTNDLLTKMTGNAGNTQTQLALSYIGLNIDAPGSAFAFNGAPVNMSYNLPATASQTQISILDQNNNVVYSTVGSKTVGDNALTWNGTDNNGQVVPNGVYQIVIGAQSATDNSALTVATTVPGRVSGIQTASDGTMNLVVNGQTIVPMSDVSKVYN